MAKQPIEQVAEASADEVTKSGEAVGNIMKGNAEALTEGSNASRAAAQELTRAYQELASKNAKNLTAAMQALALVKSPAEFIELQQKLIKDGVEAAVADSRHIAQLTAAVFSCFRASEKADRGGAEDRTKLDLESQKLVRVD